MEFTVSASVVTYNNANEIDTVLNCLEQSSIIKNLRIFVVDNKSVDNTVNIVRENHSTARLFVNDVNKGYGGGHNTVISKLDSKYHLVINPDIKFNNTLIEEAISFMECNPNVVLMIPQICDFNWIPKDIPRRDPTIRYLVGSYLSKYTGMFSKWRNQYCTVDTPCDQPYEIQFCSGSFMVFRTESFCRINGFDERFFLYFEDCDISRRIRRYGKIICNPLISVCHLGKRESHANFKAFVRMIESGIRYFKIWGFKF
jgi:GT2 family glycosyltransferase